MKKIFAKKESELICNLLTSKSMDYIQMGMNMLLTHPRSKSLNKLIVQRIRPKYRRFYNIAEKISFSDVIKIYQHAINLYRKGKINLVGNDFFIFISKFVKKRTFKNK